MLLHVNAHGYHTHAHPHKHACSHMHMLTCMRTNAFTHSHPPTVTCACTHSPPRRRIHCISTCTPCACIHYTCPVLSCPVEKLSYNGHVSPQYGVECFNLTPHTHTCTHSLTNTHTHTRLRVLLQQLEQGDTPNLVQMKKTISFAADVLLKIVPIPISEERE